MKAELILAYIAKLQREKAEYPNCQGSQAEIDMAINDARKRLAAVR